MRSLGLLLAAALLGAAAPPPPMDFQAYEQALAGSHFNDAAAFIDNLIKERVPADGKLRPDPLINALLGRLYLVARNVDGAAIYLDRAPIAELPEPLRAATALDHGRILEMRGDREAALAAFREAATASSTDVQRRRAALGIARALLPVSPALVPDSVAAIANGPPVPERWEAKYLLALSASLLGNAPAAARFADDAWSDSINAPMDALAPLQVAAVRAALAAARHDVTTERAMLLATNGLTLTAAPELNTQLPVCGDKGLTPSDYVIFAYVAGPYVNWRLVPVAASRIAAVAPLTGAVAAINPIAEGDGLKPLGTTFTVSCRTVVASTFATSPKWQDPLLEWFADNGVTPASASFESDDEHINAIADRIDGLAARFGKDSPLLIGPRWQMTKLLEKRARGGDPILPGQVADLGSQIAAGMRRAGAPEWMTRTMDIRVSYEQAFAAAQADPAQAPTYAALSRQQFLRLPFRFSRELLMSFARRFKDGWPDSASQVVIDLSANAPADLSGRDRQAWLLALGDAQRSLGKNAEARATLASAGFPTDLCIVADSRPALLEQHFSYADYPHDLVSGDQEGAVLFEFDLSAAGAVSAQRVVYSLPSGIFDAPSAKGLSTVRYTPPTRNGKASACRGVYQPIVWRLENSDDFSGPTFSSETPGPTS